MSAGTTLSTAEAIGIAVVITFLLSFVAGGILVGVIVHYYHLYKQEGKSTTKEESHLEVQ